MKTVQRGRSRNCIFDCYGRSNSSITKTRSLSENALLPKLFVIFEKIMLADSVDFEMLILGQPPRFDRKDQWFENFNPIYCIFYLIVLTDFSFNH